jgi:CPA1 family monovalent cation:H+ antiporter
VTINEIIALVLTITAAASYINYRFLRLPQPIGVTLITIILAISIILLGSLGLGVGEWARGMLEQINLSDTLLNGMLSFLLFAGALHINIIELAKFRWVVGSLATISVILSTLFIGFLTYYTARWLNIEIPLIYALIFGALISPTDPIATLAILKIIHAPKNIEMKIAGESLFNDGIAIVLFLVLLQIAMGQQTDLVPGQIMLDFTRQAGGGILLGVILGWIVAKLMREAAKFEVACLLTLALVTGGFVFADDIVDVSGPICMVVAGLIIGNMLRSGHMPEASIYRLDEFWELVDEVLNTVLFVLIGLEIIHLIFSVDSFELALLAIPICLLSRYVSVAIPVTLINKFKSFNPKTIALMTWGGLRGGVSIALALQLPDSPQRDMIIWLTYSVVIFSIIVQGLTIKPLMQRWFKHAD